MWNGLFESQIRVVIPFEIKQRIYQRSPFSFRNADGEQDKNRVVSRFLHLDSLVIEVSRYDLGWDAPILDGTVTANTRRDHRHLDRIEHGVAVLQIAEPVPGVFRVQDPRLRIEHERIFRRVFKRSGPAGLRVAHHLCIPGLEKPLAASFKLFADASDHLPETYGFLNGLGG